MNVAPSRKAAVYVVSEKQELLDVFTEGKLFFASLAYASEVVMQNTKDVVVTNEEIASDIGISISQVVAAMNVLKNEFQAFRKDYAYWSFGNTFRRKGQIIDMSAWWS
jgi:hypothetical protein